MKMVECQEEEICISKKFFLCSISKIVFNEKEKL